MGKRLTKAKTNNARQQAEKLKFETKEIQPLTQSQTKTFDEYDNDQNLLLHGSAGTGKSFISLYLAIDEIMNTNSDYHKILLVRSVVPSRDMGFLPGGVKDKIAAYESPYYTIFSKIFGRDDAYDILKQKKLVEFISTSFLRGMTLENCIVVVDEMQNMTFDELSTIITRLGEKSSKIIFCGDTRQTDFVKDKEKSGLVNFMRIIERMKSFSCIEFGLDDIVRKGIVREFLVEREKLGI